MDGTFDHRGPITTMQHLVEDFEIRMCEDELTHGEEILERHDSLRDPGLHDITFRECTERNAEFGSPHHVFDTRLVGDAVSKAGFEVLAVELLRRYHIAVLARRPLNGGAVSPFSGAVLRAILRKSPFRTDRKGS